MPKVVLFVAGHGGRQDSLQGEGHEVKFNIVGIDLSLSRDSR